MITIPAESEIDGLDVISTVTLAEALLIDTTELDIEAVKRLVITARRCLDPGADDEEADPDIGQDQVAFEEAVELYDNLAIGGTLDDVDEATEDPLDYIIAIASYLESALP